MALTAILKEPSYAYESSGANTQQELEEMEHCVDIFLILTNINFDEKKPQYDVVGVKNWITLMRTNH
jgi:hypothetical protein